MAAPVDRIWESILPIGNLRDKVIFVVGVCDRTLLCIIIISRFIRVVQCTQITDRPSVYVGIFAWRISVVDTGLFAGLGFLLDPETERRFSTNDPYFGYTIHSCVIFIDRNGHLYRAGTSWRGIDLNPCGGGIGSFRCGFGGYVSNLGVPWLFCRESKPSIWGCRLICVDCLIQLFWIKICNWIGGRFVFIASGDQQNERKQKQLKCSHNKRYSIKICHRSSSGCGRSNYVRSTLRWSLPETVGHR